MLSNLNTTWDNQAIRQWAIAQGIQTPPALTTYDEARNFVLKLVENAQLYEHYRGNVASNAKAKIHNDSIGLPTLGYGLNLTRSDLAASEITLLFQDVFGSFSQSQSQAVDILTKWKGANTPYTLTVGGQPVDVLLNNADIIAGATGGSVQSAGRGLSALELNALQTAVDSLASIVLTEAQADRLIEIDMVGLTVGGQVVLAGREASLTSHLGAAAALAPSIERVAIMSMYYNAPSLVGPGLKNAITHDERAIAWWEMRFNNTFNSLLEGRRERESEMFGLISEQGKTTVDLEEYKTALGILFAGTNRPGSGTAVNPYDHTSADSNYGTQFLLNALNDEMAVLENVYARYDGGAATQVDIIQTDYLNTGALSAKAAAGKLDSNTINLMFGGAGSDVIDGKGGNDFLYGDAGIDTLFGGDGDDVLQGGADPDHLHGGSGNNVLVGSGGDDTAYYDFTPTNAAAAQNFGLQRAQGATTFIFNHGDGSTSFQDKVIAVNTIKFSNTASPTSFKFTDNSAFSQEERANEASVVVIAEGASTLLDFSEMAQGVNIGASDVAQAVGLYQQYIPSTRQSDFWMNAIRTLSVTDGPGMVAASGEKFSRFDGLRATNFNDNLGLVHLSPGGPLTPAQQEALGAAKRLSVTPGSPAAIGAALDARVTAAAAIPQNQLDVTIEALHGDDRVLGTETGHNIIRGGDGKDTLTAGGFTSEVYGGAGADRLIGAGLKSHLYGGDGTSHDNSADLFSVANHTFVMDAGTEDVVTWGDGFVLTGGVKQWYMEGDWHYWTPFGSLIGALPMASLNVASVFLYTLDAITGTTFRYGLSETNQLIVQFGRGRGGQAIIENYHADLDTGKSTGNILIFSQSVVNAREKGLTSLRNYVALALKAGWGLEFSGSDPLVLDLDGDGVELLRRESSKVFFDVDNDGFAEDTGWVSGDDGILARDLNSNGKIENISELFGNETTSGFAALGALDSNADGKITSADAGFASLRVWRDLDSDAVTDTGELQTLAQAGITEISLANTAPAETDLRGNTVRAEGTFKRSDGSTSVVADVVLNVYQTDSKFLGAETTSSAADALPDLKGYGDMQRLRVVMSGDATLLSLVQGLPAAGAITSWAQMRTAAAAVLFRWAGVDGMTPVALDANLNTQQLAFLEKYLGYDLAPRDGGGAPTAATAAEMAQAWQDVLSNATIRLFAQGPLAGIFSAGDYNADTDRVHAVNPTDLGNVLVAVITALPTVGAAQALQNLWGPAVEAFLDAFVRVDRHDVRADYAMQALVAATEAASSSLSLAELAAGFGLTEVRIGDGSVNTLARNGANGLVTYVGGAGNDTLNGGTGQDVYVFGTGFGQDTINDAEFVDTGDRLRFATLDSNEVTLSRVGLDLVVSVNGTSDKVTVKNQFITPVITAAGVPINGDHGVEEIQFADGKLLEAIDIAAAIGVGTSASETLEGTGTSDEIEGLGGNDLLKGGDSGDTYYYTAGDGNDVIEDVMTNPLLSTADTLVLLGGIGLEDLDFERIGASDDLKLIVDSNGASITIKGQFDYTPLGYDSKFALNQRIEAVFLSDGTAITWYELQSLVIQKYTTAGSETTYGFGTADDFYASAGNDLLVGFDGGDNYVFGKGAGTDRIHDQSQYVDSFVAGLVGHSWTTSDTLTFGHGIALEDLTFTRSAATKDLVITIAGETDQLTITNQFDGRMMDLFGLIGVKWMDRIETFKFADGSSITWQDMLEIVTTGGAGNDTLVGDFTQDTLDGGAGNDYLDGGDEADTYRFGVGDGQDVIEERPGYLISTGGDKLVFKAGVAVADVVFTRDGADLVASIVGTTDQIRIKNQYVVFETGPFGAQAYHRIDEFRWADNTVKTWQQLHQQVIDQSVTTGADTILGTHFDDNLDGGAGNDTLSGGNGSDTYRFSHSTGGNDTIQDAGTNILAANSDKVIFGVGSDADDFVITRTGDQGQNAVFTHAVTGASLTINNQFAYTSIGYRPDLVETIEFADGTIWTSPQLMATYLNRVSTSGADTILGFWTDDTIIGLAGADILKGGDGSDTYVFNLGSGSDIIREFVGNAMYRDTDVIEFGAGFNIADIRFAVTGNDLVITFAGMSEQITVEGQFLSQAYFGSWTDIELIRFAGGAELTAQDIRNTILANAATSGADTINGFFTADVLSGGAGNDTLRGSSGGDTYIFNSGGGADVIEESLPHHPFLDGPDTVRFGAGIARTSVSFTRTGNDLIATISGGGGSVTVKDHFLGGAKTVEFFEFADGSIVTRQTAEAGSTTAQSTSGADTVIATNSAEVLNGGLGNDRLEGRGGNDTYQFDRGSGQDTIYDDNGVSQSTDDVLAFGAGITPDMVSIVRAANLADLVFTISGGSDQVTIEKQFHKYNLFSSSEWNLIERVTFADGSAWTIDDIRARLLRESITSGADTINGFWTDEVIDGGGGNDTINGRGGIDRFVLGETGGTDIAYADGDDVLKLGAGLTLDEIAVSRSGNDMIVTVLATGASMRIVDQFFQNTLGNRYYSVASLEVADGTILTRAQLDKLAFDRTFTSGNDVHLGLPGNETFLATPGNDTHYGAGGADIFMFGRGSGNDIVDDTIDNGPTPVDAIQFADGLTLADIVFEGQNSSGIRSTLPTQLMIRIKDTTDTLLIKGHFQYDPLGNSKRVEEFRFSDGTILTYQDVEEHMTTGAKSALNDDIFGLAGPDVLDGGAGTDTLTGGHGGDAYVFDRGYGADTIVENGNDTSETANADTIRFGGGIIETDVVFQRVGADLVVSILGANDILTVKDQFSYAGNILDRNARWVEKFAFANGNTLSIDQVRQRIMDALATAAADTITGYHGSQTLDGSVGADTLKGMEEADTYIVSRNAGADTIEDLGLSTGDIIRFKAGIAPSDVTFNRLNLDLFISIAGSADTIKVQNHFYVSAGGNATSLIEFFDFADGTRLDHNQVHTLTQTSTINGTSGADTLTGNNVVDVTDVINGLGGNDTISGLAGNDQLNGGDGADTAWGGDGNDIISGGDGDDTLHGENGNDTIHGGAGNDVMTGGANIDWFDGGAGVDTLDSSAHTQSVTVNLGAGTIVYASYPGADEVVLNTENVITSNAVDTITGSSADNLLIARGGNDTLSGLGGNDRLDGGAGNDAMSGGQGDDTFVVDSATDVVTEAANEGVDTVEAYVTYSIASYANVERLTLGGGLGLNGTGNAGNNVLTGNSGNNRLDGGAGADVMQGAAGNDTYVVDNAGDAITEAASAGTDAIEASVSYTAPNNVENIILTGTSHLNATGNSLANALTGNSGNNRLDGQGGADWMGGGAGNDTYVVDSASDVLIENSGAGTDTVEAFISFNLATNFENLTIVGTGDTIAWSNGNSVDNTMTGNAGSNSLFGGNGNDTLLGMDGNDFLGGGSNVDTLEGGAGNDTLYGDLGADTYRYGSSFGQDIIDENGQNGTTEIDRIKFTSYNSSALTFGLANGGLDLVITVASTSHTITVKNHFATAKQDWLEEIEFANGTIWNRAQIASAAGLPPIVFDLDGDGIELVSRLDSTVRFDTDNDGQRQRTGWVGADDGILALDRNRDGRITKGNEISFIADRPGATSDLEGLSAFDSNANGSIDAGDASFGKFRIWRDANQDGISQSQELRSLSAWGIASISLTASPTFERMPGLQDNAILGVSAFTRQDGSTGVAADVALSYDDGFGAANQPARQAGRDLDVRERLVDRLAARPGRFRVAADGLEIVPQAGISALSEQAQSSVEVLGTATAAREYRTGMYGMPDLLDDAAATAEAYASSASQDAGAMDAQRTMQRDVELVEHEWLAEPRALGDAIESANTTSWYSQDGWRSAPLATVSQYERSLPRQSERPDLVNPEVSRTGEYDRNVLLMIDAMAMFNVRPNAETSQRPPTDLVAPLQLLAADVRAA